MSETSTMDSGATTAPSAADNATAPQATPVADNVQPHAAEPSESWEWREGMPGDGDMPDYFHKGTFKNIEAQAAGYSKLLKDFHSRLGGFTGAPENYDFKLSDDMVEKGVTFDTENPYFKDFAVRAKELNMSQDTFSEMCKMWANSNHATAEADDALFIENYNLMIEQHEAALGAEEAQALDHAVQRAANLPGVSQAGLEQIMDSICTADAARVMTALIGNTGLSTVPSDAHVGQNVSHSTLMKRLQEVRSMSGPARAMAEKQLNADYAKLFPGNREFGGYNS